jgi:hypothetical protein
MKFTSPWLLSTVGLIGASLLVVGCNQPSSEKPVSDAGVKHDDHHSDNDEGHDHGHGPHDGAIIELGSADYHAELVHDDAAGTATIYILDGAAEKPAAIETEEITINATLDGAGSQFKLAAAPASDDPAGKSSVFASSDPKLLAALDAEGSKPQLVVTVDGKQHRGVLTDQHHEH